MKDTAKYIELIKRIYDEIEKSYKETINKINVHEVSEEIINEAFQDIVERLKVKLNKGKCSQVILNQLARHHCNIGERFGERVEIYFSRDIIDIIELLDYDKYPARQFERVNSLIKGLWKSHHNGRSQFYAYSKNIKQYWFKKNGVLKRDISKIIEKYQDNLSAIMTEMQYQAMNEKHKNNEMTGEWIVFAKYNDINYYLCLAVHDESGVNDINTYNIIENSFNEFHELRHYKHD